MSEKKAVYAGSFDPVTLGHLDVIRRGAEIFDSLVVAVAKNIEKKGFFTPEERVGLIRECTGGIPGVEVDTFQGMTVDYALEKDAGVLLRGVRSVSDFENEYQLTQTNRRFSEEIQTVILFASAEYSYFSSRYIMEAARLGGDISPFVPEPVKKAICKKLG